MQLLIATHNPAKAAQLRELLAELPVQLVTPVDIPYADDFAEDAPVFLDNAVGKARHACRATGLPTIADDSGLEIDALGGWPGVHSRRIFGDGRRATDEEMIAETMRRMEGVHEPTRTCRMHSIAAFAAPDGVVATGEGFDEGRIAMAPSSHRIPGYPFRSLFFHPEHHGITADLLAAGAPISVAVNRDRAITALLPHLHAWLSLHRA